MSRIRHLPPCVGKGKDCEVINYVPEPGTLALAGMICNDRAAGIALLRQWARDEVVTTSPREAHLGLLTAMSALLEEFRVEFDVPGTRYWHHPESDAYFSTRPGEDPVATGGIDAELLIELTRPEFIGRQDLHFGYDDRL